MKFDLYINVDPPDHEIGRAFTIAEVDKHATITNIFFTIPIGGMIPIYLSMVNSLWIALIDCFAKKGTGSKSLLSYGYYFIRGLIFNKISFNFSSSRTETGLNSFSD